MTHALTGTWRLAWTEVNSVRYSGQMIASLANVSSALPMRLATVRNMRQSVDMRRGTWVDALDISVDDGFDEFRGVWTSSGIVDDVLPALPIPVRVVFECGILRTVSGTPPPWLDVYVDREMSLSAIAQATTISMGPSFRIDRDSQGRLAMMTRDATCDF